MAGCEGGDPVSSFRPSVEPHLSVASSFAPPASPPLLSSPMEPTSSSSSLLASSSSSSSSSSSPLSGLPPASSSSLSLVPFSLASPFHDALREPERCVSIAGRDFRIAQAWKADGRGGTDLGFGASLYPSAIVLADFLATHADELVKGKRVVELGAGLGLSAMAAAAAGATKVWATDGDPLVVDLLRRNLAANGDRSREGRSEDDHEFIFNGQPVEPLRLLWGDRDAVAPLVSAGVDLVVAADVVAPPYEEAYDALIDTMAVLSEVVRKEDGRVAPAVHVVLAYQARHGSEQRFFRRLTRRGFRVVRPVAREELHRDFRVSDGVRPAVQVMLFSLCDSSAATDA